MKIAKSFTFESAHYIQGHPRCGNIHGHTWTLTVYVVNDHLNPNGMVLDFSELGGVVKLLLAKLDHKIINYELENDKYFSNKPITAETLVIYLTRQIANQLETYLNYVPQAIGCRLQEGPGGWAEYWLGEDISYGR